MSERESDLHRHVELVTRFCLVCSAPVVMQAGVDEPALCIEHFFSEDPTEEWERD